MLLLMASLNLDKVLEEVKEVEGDSNYISHHGLLQTATGMREVARQLGRRPVKMLVKSAMIVTKARDNTLVALTREVAHWLMKTPRYGSDLGVSVYVDEKLQKSKQFDSEGLNPLCRDAQILNPRSLLDKPREV